MVCGAEFEYSQQKTHFYAFHFKWFVVQNLNIANKKHISCQKINIKMKGKIQLIV